MISDTLCNEILTVARQEVRRRIRVFPALAPFELDLRQDCFAYAWEAVQRRQPRVPGAYARLRCRLWLNRYAAATYLSGGIIRDYAKAAEGWAPPAFDAEIPDAPLPPVDDRLLDVPAVLRAVRERYPVGAKYLEAGLLGGTGEEIARQFGVSKSAVGQRIRESVAFAAALAA